MGVDPTLTPEQIDLAETILFELRQALPAYADRLRAIGAPDLLAESIIVQATMIAGWDRVSSAARREGREPVPKRFVEMAKKVVARDMAKQEITRWVLTIDRTKKAMWAEVK